ncbi:hypothetical protein FACS1894102_2070 [Spirochaetia bacterium]|nr:hypothetical protein FACS1894102_2070 [Spirochaetia bacterium]
MNKQVVSRGRSGKLAVLAASIFLIACFISCTQPTSETPPGGTNPPAPPPPKPTPTPTAPEIQLSTPLEQAWVAGDTTDVEYLAQQNFELDISATSGWLVSGPVYIIDERSDYPNAAANKVIKFPYDKIGTNSLTIELTGITQRSALTFKHKTDIYKRLTVDQTFKITVNGKGDYSLYGYDAPWREETIVFSGDSDNKAVIKFEAINGSNYYWPTQKNAVYIDDISVVSDYSASIAVYPRASSQTYIGAKNFEKVVLSAKAFRRDGSERTNANARNFTYTPSNNIGTLSNDPVRRFTPSAAGSTTFTVSSGALTSSPSGIITVYADSHQTSITYPIDGGTTYTGFVSESGNAAALSAGLTLTSPSPKQKNVTANGFLLISGTVSGSTIDNATNKNLSDKWALIEVHKAGVTDQDGNVPNRWFVKNTFKERIWFRYGTSGTYEIKIKPLTKIAMSTQGFIGSWEYSRSSDTSVFSVTNTASKSSKVISTAVDNRSLFPSAEVQSDSFVVSNLAREITFGISDPAEKARAIHDWIIKNTAYDSDSVVTANRKNQDVLTVLAGNPADATYLRYHADKKYDPSGHYKAVCEGYANVMIGFLRATGMEAEYWISNEINHAWNRVWIPQASAWKFTDATWDDPLSGENVDLGPNSVYYDYFLLNNPNGIDNDHPKPILDPTRNIK